jgi:4-aminobutyrate aminotransferase/(S)-3-amino-2-methylpropionate transaminase
MTGDELPLLRTETPGPETRAWVERLAEVECPAITARRAVRARAGGRDPIVWAEARGANVVDADGNRYVDLTAGFAVASVGHAHPEVVRAGQEQLARLPHAMGDLFPSREKVLLGERLAALAPGDLQQSIFGCSGADAVEAAIKTALVATGRSRVLAFAGSYHGMSLGALGVSGYRDAFRQPFASFAGARELRLPYPGGAGCRWRCALGGCAADCADIVERWLESDVAGAEDVAAVIVEPIQGRGGIVAPPEGWLRRLRDITARHGVLLIVDEIYTGFGRTGARFVCEAEGVVPDVLCVGKGMAGGFPISAAIGRGEVMERWAATGGESIHTQTFLGNPVGCAMALATIELIERDGLAARAGELGARSFAMLHNELAGHPRVAEVRGRGLMLGVALRTADGAPWAGGGVAAMHALLDRGFIVSPAGPLGDVISLTPPLTIDEQQLEAGLEAVVAWVRTLG